METYKPVFGSDEVTKSYNTVKEVSNVSYSKEANTVTISSDLVFYLAMAVGVFVAYKFAMGIVRSIFHNISRGWSSGSR